jgi:primosomal protein N' (replication factor Y) (superfamily II helicase)
MLFTVLAKRLKYAIYLFTMQKFATVVLPLALSKPYSYEVPDTLKDAVQFGIRVEVQFGSGRNLYAALVIDVSETKPDYPTKQILQIIDAEPVVTKTQIQFWHWISSYYCCSLGEVMIAALPAQMKLSSDTFLKINATHNLDFSHLTDTEFLVAEALTLQKELSIADVQQILGIKSVYPIINKLLAQEILEIREELQTKWQPKKAFFIRLNTENFANADKALQHAFDAAARSEKQTAALLAFVQNTRQLAEGKNALLKVADLCKLANIDVSVLRVLEKKGVFEILSQEVSRIAESDAELTDSKGLTAAQEQALSEIKSFFLTKNTVLLQGVTGSGKTLIYIKLIQEALARAVFIA